VGYLTGEYFYKAEAIMSVSIEKGATFLGIPLMKVRNVLKAWRYGKSRDAHEIAVRKDVRLDPRTVMVLLDELRDRGLIGPEKSQADQEFDGVTEAGASLLAAKATRRTNKAKAWKILKNLLKACAEVNARGDLPFDVQEVWLFGSMIDDGKSDIADVDIVPVFGRPKPFSDFKRRDARFRELADQMGGAPVVNNAGVFAPLRAESYVVGQLIYGGHRHHLLAPNDLDQLLRLASPCKLIFDKNRNGEVDDPVLPRHPNSPGRSNSIGDRHEMPDLLANRKMLRPLPVCMTEPGRFHCRTMIETGPWLKDDRPYRWVQDKQNNIEIIMENRPVTISIRQNVVTARLSLENLDGRERFALFVCQRTYPNPREWSESVLRPLLGLVIGRAIHETEDRIRYDLQIVDGASRGKHAGLIDLYAATWWVYLMATADIEHILRRDAEAGLRRSVEVSVGAPVNRAVAERFAAEFSKCTPSMAEHFRDAASLITVSKLPDHIASLLKFD
jgi:hypothetical protein